MHRAASAPIKARGRAGCLASPGLGCAGRGEALLLLAIHTETARTGLCRRMGVLRETINLHDLMKTEENNNNKKRINP